jgi:hypothetical protein
MSKQGLALSGAGVSSTLFHLGVVRLPREVAVETTTATWESIVDIFPALAQIARRLIQVRMDARLMAARTTGTARREEIDSYQRTPWIRSVAIAGARS